MQIQLALKHLVEATLKREWTLCVSGNNSRTIQTGTNSESILVRPRVSQSWFVCRSGIIACQARCNADDNCRGFVWWDRFGCRTYSSCESTEVSTEIACPSKGCILGTPLSLRGVAFSNDVCQAKKFTTSGPEQVCTTKQLTATKTSVNCCRCKTEAGCSNHGLMDTGDVTFTCPKKVSKQRCRGLVGGGVSHAFSRIPKVVRVPAVAALPGRILAIGKPSKTLLFHQGIL